MNQELSPEELSMIFDYYPVQGELRWKNKAWIRTQHRGKEAGRFLSDGSRVVTLDGVDYGAHRIAWALHHGAWPRYRLRHKNRRRGDNRIENLVEMIPRRKARPQLATPEELYSRKPISEDPKDPKDSNESPPWEPGPFGMPVRKRVDR